MLTRWSVALGAIQAAVGRDPGFPRGFGEPRHVLCPRLRTTYSPRSSWRDPATFAAEPEVRRPEQHRQGTLCEAAGDRPGCWFEPPPEGGGAWAWPSPEIRTDPPKRGRYGLKGFPPSGRRQVWRGLCLLEGARHRLSFWTVSLPGPALDWIAQHDRLTDFAQALRHVLVRALRRKDQDPLVVSVCELQPDRSANEYRPCPHFHVVFVGKNSSRGHWYFSTSELDAMIVQVLERIGCFGIDCSKAGTVVPVKKSVRAYLSCYLRKKNVDVTPWIGTHHETLLPRQWWQWSRPLQQWAKGHTVPTDPAFLPWVHENRVALGERGLIGWRVVPIENPQVPVTLEVNWLTLDKLAQVVSLWHEIQWEIQFWNQCNPSLGCS